MLYFILDLEYNQYYDFRGSKRMPEPACPSEIIQMGVVIMDEKLNVKFNRETLVRPQIFQRLHPHVERITGIKPADLQKAPAFPDAFEKFFDFAFGKRAIFCTWGADDIKELYKNILFYGLNYKRLTRRFMNVQKIYSSFLASKVEERKPDPEFQSTHNNQIGLKTAVNDIGLPAERPFHTALSDAEYTTDILKYIINEKSIPARLQIQTLNLQDLKDQISSRVHSVNIRLLYKHAEHLLNRKLTERDRDVFLDIYKLGRLGAFDVPRKNTSRVKQNNKGLEVPL